MSNKDIPWHDFMCRNNVKALYHGKDVNSAMIVFENGDALVLHLSAENFGEDIIAVGIDAMDPAMGIIHEKIKKIQGRTI